MPQLILVDREERIQTVIEGITYFIRRVKPKEKDRIIAASTSRRSGQLNYGAFCEGMITAGLLGWKEGEILDINKKPVPFSLEAAENLPANHRDELVLRIGGNTEREEIETENELKNLETTPSSNS